MADEIKLKKMEIAWQMASAAIKADANLNVAQGGTAYVERYKKLLRECYAAVEATFG